jgi:hypothetical protein
MTKGKTSTGFEFEIDPRAVKDVRFVRKIAKAQNDGTLWPEIIDEALGVEQSNRLCEHIADEDGFQPLEKLISEFNEIVEYIGKNS